jgi:nucleoid-associated protein YgaU
MQIVIDPISVPTPGALNDARDEPKLPSADEAPAADFHFDGSTRQSHSEQPVPLGGVPRALREAAELSGLDPLNELYNEALRYAQEGHLRLARERLQMLLCMAPDDGQARLMLARVHVAGQRWQDAISALDEAANVGVSVPPTLRRAVEDHLEAERASAEEHRSALRAREQGEVRSLRAEARRLRSENAQLTGRATDLEREVRKWAWATVGVSSLATLFIVASLLFGGGTAEAEAPTADEMAAAEAEELLAEENLPEGVEVQADAAAVQADPQSASVAAKAVRALSSAPMLDGTALELKVKDGKAVLSGEVTTHKQRKEAEKVLSAVSGVDSVDTEAVVVLARTRGATHTVASGNTLSHIAYHYYGDSQLVKPIMKANGVTAKSLKIGQELTIPPVE